MRLPRSPTVIVVGRVAGLCPGMQMHVGGEAEVEPRPSRQHPARQIERDPVRAEPEELDEPYVAPCSERERRQELLAELPVRDPRRALLDALE